ncbi:MAG: toll/interleukin-1 receptor domain-containing protein, partial [Muribaculaceae bacterium]|nr:toll/interleukin-1 receptor domain-containing protein [Muribaculaceae bacterium]
MEKAKYDVFISYSRKDYVDDQKQVIPGNVVSKIKEALTKAGITYWFDEEGIYSGDTFTEKIVTNIEAANIFVFLSSANSNASSWTSKEIASADEFHKRI